MSDVSGSQNRRYDKGRTVGSRSAGSSGKGPELLKSREEYMPRIDKKSEELARQREMRTLQDPEGKL